jgi:hypothetical protein
MAKALTLKRIPGDVGRLIDRLQEEENEACDCFFSKEQIIYRALRRYGESKKNVTGGEEKAEKPVDRIDGNDRISN